MSALRAVFNGCNLRAIRSGTYLFLVITFHVRLFLLLVMVKATKHEIRIDQTKSAALEKYDILPWPLATLGYLSLFREITEKDWIT